MLEYCKTLCMGTDAHKGQYCLNTKNVLHRHDGRPQGANPTIYGVQSTQARRIVGLAPCGRPLDVLQMLNIFTHVGHISIKEG